jgi:hypothetical protein
MFAGLFLRFSSFLHLSFGTVGIIPSAVDCGNCTERDWLWGSWAPWRLWSYWDKNIPNPSLIHSLSSSFFCFCFVCLYVCVCAWVNTSFQETETASWLSFFAWKKKNVARSCHCDRWEYDITVRRLIEQQLGALTTCTSTQGWKFNVFERQAPP